MKSSICNRVNWPSRVRNVQALYSSSRTAFTARRPGDRRRKRVFSGIQPTGIPHLGNYLGALRQWKQLQDEKLQGGPKDNYGLFFCVVDLHALTHQTNRKDFLRARRDTFASLLAIGLDPRHCGLFFQSEIPAHAELMWILSTLASTGYLSRMTQWKSKLGLSEEASLDQQAVREKLKLGLFSYPVLQAADILLYRPELVPVGEDQAQHIEFARSLARSFNSQYESPSGQREAFIVPELMLSPAKRVMSLKNPRAKMSKSDADVRSRILITDTPDTIRARLRGTVTDSIDGISYDPENRPGISNLVEILRNLKYPKEKITDVAQEHATISKQALKEEVAEAVVEEFRGIREKFDEITQPGSQALLDAWELGRARPAAVAANTMQHIKEVIGLTSIAEKQTAKPQKTDVEQEENQADKLSDEDKERKAEVEEEQIQEEKLEEGAEEVVPQKDQGVDRPLAS